MIPCLRADALDSPRVDVADPAGVYEKKGYVSSTLGTRLL